MKVFLINLDHDTERLKAADAQLRKLGVSYERIGAICGKDLDAKARMLAIDRFRWWCAIGRPVRSGEIGCAMSHYRIYRRMVDEDIPLACVLEDDVILTGRFAAMLQYIETSYDLEKPQLVLLSNHERQERAAVVDTRSPMLVRARTDMFAEGYVLGKICARNLLTANWPMQTPCDHWGRWRKQGLIELYHAFPPVCSQDQRQYASGTVEAGCFNVHELSWPRWFIHKCCRLVGWAVDNVLSTLTGIRFMIIRRLG